jgi:GNAT superfamily N-acetyltransferase
MPPILTIRAATPADLETVDRLLGASYPRLLAADYPPSMRVLAVPRIARANPALLASGSYFLAHANGTLVASGGWTPAGRDRVGVPLGAVRHVATHPDHLRRGLARAIMRHAMADAARRGVRRLDCLSTRTAVPFYRALGFETLGPIDIGLAPGIAFPAVAMRRCLHATAPS